MNNEQVFNHPLKALVGMAVEHPILKAEGCHTHDWYEVAAKAGHAIKLQLGWKRGETNWITDPEALRCLLPAEHCREQDRMVLLFLFHRT